MKKIVSTIIFLLILPAVIVAQNFNLKINSNNLPFDSLFLKSFDGKSSFENTIAIRYNSNAILKQKGKLSPGWYKVYGDTVALFDLLISDIKQQSFSVKMSSPDDVIFEGSDENNKYRQYTQQIADYSRRFQELNRTFEDAQKSMPEYMLKTLADTLIAKANRLMEAEFAYKHQLIEENRGLILSSIVQMSLETPPPPQHYYQNQLLLRQYFASHFFDNYPFDDERILHTQAAVMSIKSFAAEAYQIDTHGGDTIMNRILTQAQISPQTYYTFFDNFERIVGTLTSPYWSEDLFLVMLRNALSYDKLEDSRRIRYTAQLDIHSKNRVGMQVPDFKLKMSNGDTTSLYKIESEYLLLYFQNPDCPTCTEVREKLAVNNDLNKALESGKLKLVTVYFEQDEALWNHYLEKKANPKYLHGWEYELKIENDKLFDLRIIPYMFLLDKDKKVIKKDILFNEISDYLHFLKIQ